MVRMKLFSSGKMLPSQHLSTEQICSTPSWIHLPKDGTSALLIRYSSMLSATKSKESIHLIAMLEVGKPSSPGTLKIWIYRESTSFIRENPSFGMLSELKTDLSSKSKLKDYFLNISVHVNSFYVIKLLL